MLRRLTPAILLLFLAPAAAAATIMVHKTPWCGCCVQWIAHLRSNGFTVSVQDHQDLAPVARRLGIPDALRSCHSAKVGGYAIEGHVPAADIKRLLASKPKAAGLAVAGMPVGSPGMEQGGRKQPYSTMIFDRSGKARLFARH